MGPGVPASGIWNAKCYACTSYSGCPSPVGRSLSGNQPCGYRRRTIPAGHSPAPVPVRSLRTSSCFLCPANGFTGRMTNPHLLNLLPFLFVPFPPQQCDTIDPLPHLLSVTSRQVGAKSTALNFLPSWQEVDFCSPDNSGQVVRNLSASLSLNKCGTICPTFPATCFHKKVAPTRRTFLAAVFYEI